MENMELENSMTDIAPAAGYTGNGVPYYDNLMQSEQMEVTEIIRLLWRQTFILEHKYDSDFYHAPRGGISTFGPF